MIGVHGSDAADECRHRERSEAIQNRPSATALVGVAPITRHSGSSIRTAAIGIGAGRKPLRDILFMAALNASQHDTLKAFYEKLVANGKQKLVALTAVMRKIVVISNAGLKDDIAKNLQLNPTI